ncbi:hypothetical protein N1851_033325 [Merluccius polli]|uniref:Uncharacterized protein n=1 Tax=Merluccius polli TaxID=89951 RepID=A0AA47M1I1_MERPO|nr:hypothetical protein N1851_033325 [Merluccius polli]
MQNQEGKESGPAEQACPSDVNIGVSPGLGPEDEEQVTTELQPHTAPRRDAVSNHVHQMLSRINVGVFITSPVVLLSKAHLSSVTHLSLVIHLASSSDQEEAGPVESCDPVQDY